MNQTFQEEDHFLLVSDWIIKPNYAVMALLVLVGAVMQMIFKLKQTLHASDV